MNYGERKRTLIRCLEDGPGTTAEIACALHWPSSLTSAHLTMLRKSGVVRVSAEIKRGRAKHWEWSLAA